MWGREKGTGPRAVQGHPPSLSCILGASVCLVCAPPEAPVLLPAHMSPPHHPHPPPTQGHHTWAAAWRVECRPLPFPIQLAPRHDDSSCVLTIKVSRNLQFTEGFLLLRFTDSSQQGSLCTYIKEEETKDPGVE